MQESGNIIVAALVYNVAPEVDKFRLDSVYRLLRSVLINWRVLCFMMDKNLLSFFGIDRDMVT